MSKETPQSSLPQRTWIAKFTPETLEAYFSDPEPSSQLRRSNTVWSDGFDNIIGPISSSDDQKSSTGWSKRQICRMRTNALPSDHNEHPRNSPNKLLQGPRSSHLLFTDDCFLDGLVEGFGIMVAAVVVLGAIVSLVWLLCVRLRLCRSTRHRCCSSSARPLLGTGPECSNTKSEVVAYMEKV